MQSNLTKKQKLIFNMFTFYFTSGVLIFNTIILKIFEEPTIFDKVKFGMILLLISIIIWVSFRLNKKLNNKIKDISDEIRDLHINITTNEETQEMSISKQQLKNLVIKENKAKSILDIFHNIVFLIPFIILFILVWKIETGAMELRGTLGLIITSLSGGFVYNCIMQFLNAKKLKGGN